MIATTMCPKCGHEYCVCVGEKYERCCGEWHLIGYEFSSYLPLAELKRRIYDTIHDTLKRLAGPLADRVDTLFPEPTGMAAYRQAHRKKSDSSPAGQNRSGPVRVEIK